MESLYLKDFPGTKYRVALVREEDSICNPSKKIKPITNSETAYQYIRYGLQNKDREFFVSILLDRRNVPLGVNLVSIGHLSSSLAHPREVFKPAILASASAMIIAHNHPSGDPKPSKEDFHVTFVLKQAGDILGIKVLDHIIVGSDSYYSMKDRGDLE